jgi:predicted metalloprotease with PDZ domain
MLVPKGGLYTEVPLYQVLISHTYSIQTKLNSRKGVVIREVVPNSPADNAGLKPGDEITQVDEHSVVGVSHEKVGRVYPMHSFSVCNTTSYVRNVIICQWT